MALAMNERCRTPQNEDGMGHHRRMRAQQQRRRQQAAAAGEGSEEEAFRWPLQLKTSLLVEHNTK
jgi:hypothetical protein